MTISEAFVKYENYAFRFESLPIYHVDGEWEDFQYYLKTNIAKQNKELILFQNDIDNMIKKGRKHIRTRILPQVPNEYIKFETQVGYIPQSKIGVEFNFILEEDFKKYSYNISLNDFWLFDDKYLFHIIYEEDGKFKKIEQIFDKNILKKSINFMKDSLKVSKTLTYLQEIYLKKL